MSDLRQELAKVLEEVAGLTYTEHFGKEEKEDCLNKVLAAFEKMLPEELETKSFIASGWNQYRKEVLERLEDK
jgi:hypothetical protein